MRWDPHPYQKTAVKHLLKHPAAGLFLDPGLGKTSVVMEALNVLQSHRVVNSALVIAPLQVCLNVWRQESDKWEFGHTVSVLHGAHKEERLQEEADIVVINPEGLPWLEKQKGWMRPRMLIVDESTKFKHTRTARFKLLKKWLPFFDRRVILTGTPMPRSLEDLFGQLYILDVGERLGAYITHYRTEYFIPDSYGHQWTPKPDSYERVIKQIKDICLYMAGEDYLELPEKIVTKLEFDLPIKARAQHNALATEYFTLIDQKKVEAVNAAALSTKLRQLVNGAVYTGSDKDWVEAHTTKLDILDDLLEQINAPTIVVYEFDHDKQRILQRHPTADVLSGASEAKAVDMINEWNAGRVPLLLIHPASAGHGLNLQEGGHHIVWFGLTWDLEHYDQTIARLWRQGQKERVFIYHIMGRDTLDQRVFGVLTAKDRRQNALLLALKKERRWRRTSTSGSRRRSTGRSGLRRKDERKPSA